MKNSKFNFKNAGDYLLIIAICIVVGLIIFTNIFHYCYKMNADIASDAVLARLIWESGEWIPKSWYPSTELRIWGTPNLAVLIYGMTSNMALAMGVACVAMTVIILLSAYFFISQFSFDRTQKKVFLLLCLILPNHFVILELAFLFAAHYATHIIVMFFTLGVYARLINEKKSNGLYMSAAVILAFMMGMQGVRGILILDGPLLATEILRQLYLVYSKSKWKDKKNLVTGVWCILLLIAGFVGTLLPFSIGQGGSRNIRKGLIKLFRTVLPDVMRCLGIPDIGAVSILYMGMLLIAIAFLALCILRVLKKRCNTPAIWVYFMLWFSTIITMLTVAFTTTESSQRYYFVILYAIALGYVYFIKWAKDNFPVLGVIGYTVIISIFIFHIYTVYRPILQSEEPLPDTKYEVCKYIEESGFQMGYANFELANTMTVLSGGKIRVAAVATMDKMDICKWLSSVDWYVPNVPYESRTAYIVTEAESDSFNKFYELHHEDIRFNAQIGQFLIYESDYNFSCLE